jgi:hypothetical protein
MPRSLPLKGRLIMGYTEVSSSLGFKKRQGWKRLGLTNTLAYYTRELVTAVYSFIIHVADVRTRCDKKS